MSEYNSYEAKNRDNLIDKKLLLFATNCAKSNLSNLSF